MKNDTKLFKKQKILLPPFYVKTSYNLIEYLDIKSKYIQQKKKFY